MKSSPLNYTDPSGHLIPTKSKVDWGYVQVMNPSNATPPPNYKPSETPIIWAVDKAVADALKWIMNKARDLNQNYNCEIQQDVYDVELGIIYSIFDNLVFQSGTWLAEMAGKSTKEKSRQFRQDVEEWMLENAVTDPVNFYAGKIIGDAFLTASGIAAAGAAIEALGKGVTSFVGGMAGGGGSFTLSVGGVLAYAEALIDQLGAAGAGIAIALSSVSGIGNDKDKFFEALENRREGGSGANNVSSESTRVGRWMSQAEYDKMVKTGKVQMSGDNKVHVANPANIDSFGKQAPPDSIYVEFDVPSNTISAGGTDGGGIINGPGSLLDRLNAKKGLPRIEDMPKATNIEIKGSK